MAVPLRNGGKTIVGILTKFRSLFGHAPISKPAVTTGATATTHEPGDADAPIIERRGRKRLNARDDLRVLIIDDSPTVCAALKKVLRSAGYVTSQALDAETGLKMIQDEHPDLIFLDIVLPGMNGFSALRKLRRNPLTRELPVIMISGNEQATEQFFGSVIGADDFMKKPFSRFEVFARIERLLDADLVPRRKTALATPTAPTLQGDVPSGIIDL